LKASSTDARLFRNCNKYGVKKMLKSKKSVANWSILFFVTYFLIVGSALGGHGDEEATMSIGKNGMAIKGYDTVAYFTENKAVRGKSEHSYDWLGAKWLFSSAKHKALFVVNPEKYAPQFGAFCAMGVALHQAVPVNPRAWTIVDGKLYLNYNLEYRDMWRKDKEKNISNAITVWTKHAE
jgi:YHS domain-containing protein